MQSTGRKHENGNTCQHKPNLFGTASLICLLVTAAVRTAHAEINPPLVASVTLSNGGGEIIRDALTSVVNWVDLCILLDTGITDDTLEIAKEAAGTKLLVKELPWPGSFSAARNAALQAAADAGAKWAMMLDTDERIVVDPKQNVLRDFLQGSEAGMVNMWHDSLTYHKPRFFRLPARGAFHGPTHEWFGRHAGAVEHTLDTTAVFAELGKDESGVRRKAVRDIGLLTAELAREPNDQRWWYYLGDAYEISGDCASAIRAWSTCGRLLQGWDEEGAWCMYRAALCQAKSAQWDAALESLAQGMARHPGLPELPWYAGWVSYQAGRYKQAKAWSHMSIALGCHTGLCVHRTGFSHPPGKYEGPYDVLKWALRALGDTQGAAEAERQQHRAEQARVTPAAH